MINRTEPRYFVTLEGLTLKSGRSNDLVKGQIGIQDNHESPNSRGNLITTNLPNFPKNRKFALKMGVAPIKSNRSQSNKSISSVPFKLSEVSGVEVSAPTKEGVNVDKMIIGYDGINVETALDLENGDNEQIHITLEGEAIGLLGYDDSKITVLLNLEAPNEGVKGTDWTMEQVVLEAVQRLKDMTLVGNVPITNYINILPVNSENPSSLTTPTLFNVNEVTVQDDGDYSSLAVIQAQYPGVKIERKSYKGGKSTYVAIVEDGSSLSDFEDKVVNTILKDCESCPSGLSEQTDSFIYQFDLENSANTEEIISELETVFSNNITGTAQNVADGVFVIALDDEVTTGAGSQDEAFTNSSVLQGSYTLLTESTTKLCTGSVVQTTSWSEVDTLNAIEETFKLQIADTDCGNNRLAELEAAYPELTITVDSSDACQTVYTTTVLTEPVAEQCDPIFRDLFFAERPGSYDQTPWVIGGQSFSSDAKMGILLEGKPNILTGDEQFRDDLPNIFSSTRIQVAGGHPTMISESFNSGGGLRFPVRLLQIATEPQSMGMDFFDWEDRSRAYFDGRTRLEGNNYGKWVLGQETHLNPTAQYVSYTIKVNKSFNSGSFSGQNEEELTYVILAEIGKHGEVEDIVNAIAEAAGHPKVTAYPSA